MIISSLFCAWTYGCGPLLPCHTAVLEITQIFPALWATGSRIIVDKCWLFEKLITVGSVYICIHMKVCVVIVTAKLPLTRVNLEKYRFKRMLLLLRILPPMSWNNCIYCIRIAPLREERECQLAVPILNFWKFPKMSQIHTVWLSVGYRLQRSIIYIQ